MHRPFPLLAGLAAVIMLTCYGQAQAQEATSPDKPAIVHLYLSET